jgi:lipoprotein-anchoring transpeptidase ErfK/SrfK
MLPFAGAASADSPAPGTVAIPIPDNVAPGEQWVDVNLSEQVAVAMNGSKVMRAILVTTGMPGWETPVGQFRILYRVADERMTSDALGIPRDSPAGYDLDHVLWTQYFTEYGHALHDNYWRPPSVFGHQATSHGCVGMVEPDARYLWDFVGVGSLVNIHY